MAAVYADLICKGKKTIEDIPAKIKQEVLQILKERGFIPKVKNDVAVIKNAF